MSQVVILNKYALGTQSIKYIQIIFHESILAFKIIKMVFKKLVIGHACKRDLLSIPSCGAVYCVCDGVWCCYFLWQAMFHTNIRYETLHKFS
jgi:hypothetical protein